MVERLKQFFEKNGLDDLKCFKRKKEDILFKEEIVYILFFFSNLTVQLNDFVNSLLGDPEFSKVCFFIFFVVFQDYHSLLGTLFLNAQSRTSTSSKTSSIKRICSRTRTTSPSSSFCLT